KVYGQPSEGGRALETPLVHVKRAVELELDGMQAGSRIAVMLSDEAARIRLVAAHRIALRAQGRFDGLGDRSDATRAVPITQHDVGARTLVLAAGARRHGMTIDQDRSSEIPVDAREKAAQRAMVRLVQPLNPPNRVVDRNALAIDFLRVADDP